MVGVKVSDFSSPEYWSERFANENSFEWLANSNALVPLILDVIKEVIRARNEATRANGATSNPRAPSNTGNKTQNGDDLNIPLHVLHFGCGTSTLGNEVDVAARIRGYPNVRIVNADYVASSIRSKESSDELFKGNQVTGSPRGNGNLPVNGDAEEGVNKYIVNLDVLELDQLVSVSPVGGWDVLVDKSTADAISCGPSRPRRRFDDDGPLPSDMAAAAGEETEEPIEALCSNLASVTRPGRRWVCISYSSSRFDHLTPGAPIVHHTLDRSVRAATGDEDAHGKSEGWKVISKTPIPAVPAGSVTSKVGDKRVVYQPETCVWKYVLERI